MDRQQFLLEMRQNHTLKGRKPCFVSLRFNAGKIYNEGYSEFIMSFRDGVIYFQKLSRFLKRLQPSGDFELRARRFKKYDIMQKSFINILYLYEDNDRFIDICYQVGKRENSSTMSNIQRIVDEMVELYNIKSCAEEIKNEPEEDTDSEGKGSN